MINLYLSAFSGGIKEPKNIAALIVAAFAVMFLLLSKKTAANIIEKKYPDLKQEDEMYSEKMLNLTLRFKITAAVVTMVAAIVTLF